MRSVLKAYQRQKNKLSGYRVIFIVIILYSTLYLSGNRILEPENVKNNLINTLEEDYENNNVVNRSFGIRNSIQPFQSPKILFIVHNSSSLSEIQDLPFIEFMQSPSLNYTVILHDANDSYNYTNFDAIVISRSIDESGTVDSLYNAPIPILTMEAGTYDEFHLATSVAPENSDELFILNSNHEITEGLTNNSFLQVYNQSRSDLYLKGYNGFDPNVSDIISLAQWGSKTNERTIVALEKGERDWDGFPTAERRAFWGAADGAFLNTDGWFRWNRTLSWILYDYSIGYSTIQINVIDKANENIEGARVTINSSYTQSNIPPQNTTILGSTTFYNIPYGCYNITVEFRDKVNDSFTLVGIAGERTYHLQAFLEYTIQINDYLDDTPPLIENINFNKDTYNFSAEITDQSLITDVFLNVTALNISGGVYFNPRNYTMVSISSNIYYNDTLNDVINHTAIEIFYNIIAYDSATNFRKTPIQSFILEDPSPPEIHEFNAIDYGNGTIEFWANITDEYSEVAEPVLLKINDTFRDMHLNGSGLWVYRTEFHYNLNLEYTIYSANDTLGQENGTKIYPSKIVPISILTSDLIAPDITRVEALFLSHDEGLVEFSVEVEETTEFQSGIDTNSIQLLLSINNSPNQTILMSEIIEGLFYTEYQFNYLDNVSYWINVSDLARNFRVFSTINNSYRIDDNKIPEVYYSAQEYGNGTIDFFATVFDWPENQTLANLHLTLEWSPDPSFWTDISMDAINDTFFSYRFNSTYFLSQDIWYYVSVYDSEYNTNDPTLYSAYSIKMTDIIKPVLSLIILNSTTFDGEITIESFAMDPFGESFGQFINNTIVLELTYMNATTSYNMSYSRLFTYEKTFIFNFGEFVEITAYVKDNMDNQANISKSIIVDDYTPPIISDYDVCDYQNGSLRIWAKVIERETGSGLPEDNSSIHLTYNFNNRIYTVQMDWNGTGNFFCYKLPVLFEPGEAFAYNLSAYDVRNNNATTDLEFYSVQDKVNPVINQVKIDQDHTNHTHVLLDFKINALDPFGNIENAFLTIKYTLNSEQQEEIVEMILEGEYYTAEIYLLCNLSCNYEIQILDEALNAASNQSSLNTLNFKPTQVSEFGVDFNTSKEFIGQPIFWISINNSYNDENITLSIYDETVEKWIASDVYMNRITGNKYIYNTTIAYNNSFSYMMKVYDSGVFAGYYNEIHCEGNNRSLDYWGPVINASGVYKSNNTLEFWAQIYDWGSGVSQVTLNLDTNPSTTLGGISSRELNTETYLMTFNGTYYVVNVTFKNSVLINWYITASDWNNNNDLENMQANPKIFNLFVETPFDIPIDNIFIETLLFMSTITLVFVIFSALLVSQYRKRRDRKRERFLTYKKRLSVIPEIYSLVITSGVGLPVISVTNVLHIKDTNLDGSLSGLSVGIDSFLESFQADFISQVQGESTDRGTAELSSQIRLSVIEKQHVQILIAASPSYRMFLFMRVKPPKFIRELFYKAISEVEENIPLEDLGIIDENLIGPQVLAIIQKSLPIALLGHFILDVNRIIQLDRIMKDNKESGKSLKAINALKQLVMIKTLHLTKKDVKIKLNSFNTLMTENNIRYTDKLIFSEAHSIMEQILKIPSENIFEALWLGCSPKIRIIIPLKDNLSR